MRRRTYQPLDEPKELARLTAVGVLVTLAVIAIGLGLIASLILFGFWIGGIR